MNTTIERTSPASPPAGSKHAFPFGRWTLFKNPFLREPRQKAAESIVQGELSLDCVTPVRNDLSDSDVELVLAGKPMSEPSQVGQAPSEGGTGNVFWKRMRTRLFGHGKV